MHINLSVFRTCLEKFFWEHVGINDFPDKYKNYFFNKNIITAVYYAMRNKSIAMKTNCNYD